MNQIIAALALFGIVTVVFAPLIAETGSQIFSRNTSIFDNLNTARQQTGQMLVATHLQQYNGTASVYISNIGVEDTTVHAVLLDGTELPFILYDQDSAQIDTLHARELGILQVNGTGSKIQIVATTGKLFEFGMQ